MATIDVEQLGDLGILTTLYSIGSAVYKVYDSKNKSDDAIFKSGVVERDIIRTTDAANAEAADAARTQREEQDRINKLIKDWGPIVGIGVGALILGMVTRKNRKRRSGK